MKLLGNNVQLLPGRITSRAEIILPERYRHNSLARVMAVGPKVDPVIEVGSLVITPMQFSEKAYQIINEKTREFVCDAKNVFATIKRKHIFPMGRRILLERKVYEQKSKAGIVIPEAQRCTDQSLGGVVIRFGMSRMKTIQGVGIDDEVILAQWEPHMIELGWQGKFCLIVNEDDIISVLK